MRLLKSSAEVRDYYNRRFQYILVDEYQDTNRPQYELMRMLAGEGHNICAVGDEDQIHLLLARSGHSQHSGIRAGLPRGQDHPAGAELPFHSEHSAGRPSVVANNLKRKGKNLWTSRQGGAQIGYYEAPDGEDEALFAADYIAQYLREAGQEEETPRAAVLYRTNSQSRLFEEAMRRYQLKYHVVGGFSFYERAEIKDLISYLKVVQNPDDTISLLRVINTPVRGIGKSTIEVLEGLALEAGLSLWGAIGEAIQRQLLPQRALSAVKNFRDLIEDARAMLAGTYVERLEETAIEPPQATWGRPPSAVQPGEAPEQADKSADTDFDPAEFNTEFDFGSAEEPAPENAVAEQSEAAPPFGAPKVATGELLKFLIDRTGYIKQLEQEDTPEAFSRVENLRELVNAAMDSRDRGETLDQFLDHAALVSDADAYDERAQITLMTLHAAKGLEFPLVFSADWKKVCSRTRARFCTPMTSKRSAACATWA